MAIHTTFYLNRTSTYTWQPTGFQGTWDLTPVSTNTNYLSPLKGGSNALGLPRSPGVATNPFKVCITKLLLGPLAAQTIVGTINVIIGVSEANADGEEYWAAHGYVSVGESNSVRGTLLNNYTENTTNEWPVTAAGLAFQSAQTLGTVVASQGDWVVLELGYIKRAATNRAGTLYVGSTGAVVATGLLPDLTVGGTGVTTHAGLVTFAGGLNLYEPAPAQDDLLASNKDLFLYDGTTGALKRRVFMPRYTEPAGGAQDAAGNLYITDELNAAVYVFDPTLTQTGILDVSPGVLPHALSMNLADQFYTGYAGDGFGTTACGDQGFSAQTTYPRTTGSIATTTNTLPARTVAPPATIVVTQEAAAVTDQTCYMGITVAEAFADNADVQPTFKIGKTGSTSLYYPTGTFVNNVLGTTYATTFTITAGNDVIITEVEAHPNFTATGSLTVVTTVVHSVAQTFVASSGSDRNVLFSVKVTTAFADGDGHQPIFTIGTTANPTLFSDGTVFHNAALNTIVALSGTLPAGQPIIVWATHAVGTTSTGAIQVTGTVSGLATQASFSVRRFTTAGVASLVSPVAADQCGSNAIDLASDQSTLFYTSLGRQVKRWDLTSNTQLPDFATLAAATGGEMARGIRILPSNGVAVADVVDIKILNASGLPQTSFSIGGQADWGTLGVTSDGLYLWAANTANSTTSPPMIAKFLISDGSAVLTITSPAVPDTGGFLCSGGITVMNGFRAGGPLFAPRPPGPPGPGTLFGPASPGVVDPIRRLRQSPHLWTGKNNHRLSYGGFELLVEAGAARDDDVPLTWWLQWSDDGGRTWSNLHERQGANLGQNRVRFRWLRLGISRDRVFRVINSDNARIVVVDALLDPDPTELSS